MMMAWHPSVKDMASRAKQPFFLKELSKGKARNALLDQEIDI